MLGCRLCRPCTAATPRGTWLASKRLRIARSHAEAHLVLQTLEAIHARALHTVQQGKDGPVQVIPDPGPGAISPGRRGCRAGARARPGRGAPWPWSGVLSSSIRLCLPHRCRGADCIQRHAALSNTHRRVPAGTAECADTVTWRWIAGEAPIRLSAPRYFLRVGLSTAIAEQRRDDVQRDGGVEDRMRSSPSFHP